jgi:hypothetical protein
MSQGTIHVIKSATGEREMFVRELENGVLEISAFGTVRLDAGGQSTLLNACGNEAIVYFMAPLARHAGRTAARMAEDGTRAAAVMAWAYGAWCVCPRSHPDEQLRCFVEYDPDGSGYVQVEHEDGGTGFGVRISELFP